ncbi:PP2C family protein-serine/threonine phosphatase [Aerosakkonemataceae cyanobacterium BLCC-F154]|uniref:PP2C family protein-serine/threonine phosphatase n=1 Tax=Floridaenema fluviatile BLCC-F154 TaxID=3153640 RepID=A0ABV4YCD2_9CYAN
MNSLKAIAIFLASRKRQVELEAQVSMIVQNQSVEQLHQELESLRQEINELRTAQAAYHAQSELLENLVAMARSSSEKEVLTATLKNTMVVSTRLTGAERGSLFIYNSSGAVVASILTREGATPEESTKLIGLVLKDGLAGWVSRHREIGLISDTKKDDRWVDLPNQPYVVSSALAVPILRGDRLLGILTLLHSKPGHFTSEHAHLMEVTADQIALALENVQLYTKLDNTKKALENELEKGKQIQKDFLPDRLIQPAGWEIAAYFSPARDVAGDFYDAFELPGGYVGLVIADVCDKGVGAALFMALFRSLIRIFSGQIQLQESDVLNLEIKENCAINPLKPDYSAEVDALKAVSLTNNYIAKIHCQLSMFATMFFGVLNPKTGVLTYINGGHEFPIIINSEGIKQRLSKTGPAVGMMENVKFKLEKVQLEPGDILLTYTDGVTEAHSPTGEFFKEKNLLTLVEKPAASADALLSRINETLRLHIGEATQFDDITMLAIRWMK